ncbi:MAG: toll/interleukin-1 receptor domain-containing protein [Chlorobium sp.]|nr:toll/interleukin-1 receptor domain-containing protein [Chlorobium sp.]
MKIFYSYSHKDEYYRNKLETHLKILERTGVIDQWHDRNIEAGDDWKTALDENLERADIILLLVSSDFIASDYCWEKEMNRALERYQTGEATVIPVIIRDVNWKSAPFAAFQALPKDAKAVKMWPDEDSAWKNVSEGIEQVVNNRMKK